MEEEFEIEDGVVIPEKAPTGTGQYNPLRKTMGKLRVGQSFLIDIERHPLTNIRGTIKRERAFSGRDFILRQTSEGYARIWRNK